MEVHPKYAKSFEMLPRGAMVACGLGKGFVLYWAAVDPGGGVWLWIFHKKGHLREEHEKEAGSAV